MAKNCNKLQFTFRQYMFFISIPDIYLLKAKTYMFGLKIFRLGIKWKCCHFILAQSSIDLSVVSLWQKFTTPPTHNFGDWNNIHVHLCCKDNCKLFTRASFYNVHLQVSLTNTILTFPKTSQIIIKGWNLLEYSLYLSLTNCWSELSRHTTFMQDYIMIDHVHVASYGLLMLPLGEWMWH